MATWQPGHREMVGEEELKQSSLDVCNADPGALKEREQDPANGHSMSACLSMNEPLEGTAERGGSFGCMREKISVDFKSAQKPKLGMGVICNRRNGLCWDPKAGVTDKRRASVAIHGKVSGLETVSYNSNDRVSPPGNGLEASEDGSGSVLSGEKDVENKDHVKNVTCGGVIELENSTVQSSFEGKSEVGHLGAQCSSNLPHYNSSGHSLFRGPFSILKRVASIMGGNPLNCSNIISRKLVHNSKMSAVPQPSTSVRAALGNSMLNIGPRMPQPVECTHRRNENSLYREGASDPDGSSNMTPQEGSLSSGSLIPGSTYKKSMKPKIKQQSLSSKEMTVERTPFPSYKEHRKMKVTPDISEDVSAVTALPDDITQGEKSKYKKGELRIKAGLPMVSNVDTVWSLITDPEKLLVDDAVVNTGKI